MSELLKVDVYDKLTVNGKTVKSGEGKTPTDVPAGSSTTINFESEVNSKGKSKIKFSFKKQTVEAKQKPQVLETLPKAQRTQVLTALTSNFVLVGLVHYAW